MTLKSFSFKRYTPTKRPKKVKPLEATTENGTPIKKKRGRPVGWRKQHTQNEDTATTATIANDSISTQNIAEAEGDSVSLESATKRGKFFELDIVEESTQDDITKNTTNNTTDNNNEGSNLAIITQPKKKAGRPKGSKNLKTLEKEANQKVPPAKEVTQVVESKPVVKEPGRGRGRPKKASISNILNPDPFVNGNEFPNTELNEIDELISETNTLVEAEDSSIPPKKRPGRPKKIVEINTPSHLIDELTTDQIKSPVKRRGRPKKIIESIETAKSVQINSNSQPSTAKRGRKKASERPNYSELNSIDYDEDEDDVDDYIEFDNEAYNDKDYNEVGGDSESDEDNVDEEFDSDDEEAYEESGINQRKSNGLGDGRGRVKPGKFKPINLSGVNFNNWVEEYDPLVKPIVYLPPNCKPKAKSTKNFSTSSNTQFTPLFPTEPNQLISLRYKLMQSAQQALTNSHTSHYKLTSNYHRDKDWQLSKVKWLINQIIYHRESIQNRGLFQKQPVITLETGLNPSFCESFDGLMKRELGNLCEKFFVRYCNLKEDLMLVRGESRKFRGLVQRVFNDLSREFDPEQNTNSNGEEINSINLQDYKQLIDNQDTNRHYSGDHRMNLNILLLPNWERFSLSLLEQLITYLIPLNIVILLPTSTSTSDTLPTLPYTLTSQLSCLKLNFQNPWKDLEQGLNFLSDVESNGLQLGIWPLLRLGKNFLNFNYSTSSWYNEFKWCLLDYYKSNALSVLIGNIGKSNYIGYIKEDVVPILVDSHLDMIRALPSFKHWLLKSTQTNEDKLKLIQDNSHFKDNFLIPKLQSLQIYLINYRQAFDLVVQLQKWVYELELSDTELDSKLYLKLEGLTRGLPDSFMLTTLLNQVETLNFQKLSILLKSLITFVNDQKSKLIRKTSAIEKFIEYLNELKELLVKYGNGEYNLKHTPNKKLANVLKQYFKIVLQPNYEIVLNELVFVMDDTLISKTFDPNLQDLLHLDLHQPDLELTSSTPNFNPDLCILYEIYLECGRLVNLYDWSIAFEDRIKAQSGGKALNKDRIYGRFLLGLETFKLWGLVATTKRKTDHVVKLI